MRAAVVIFAIQLGLLRLKKEGKAQITNRLQEKNKFHGYKTQAY